MADDVHRFSDIIEALAERPGSKVTVADVLDAFGDRAFGALLAVFAAPLALPMPPGVSAILGAPLIFIAFQQMIGRPTLWLPKALMKRSMRRAEFLTMTVRLRPHLKRLERHLRPRLQFLYGPIADRFIGAVCVLLAVIVFLPIPFGNMLPSFAIAAFGFGLLERDGLAGLVGGVAAAISVIILILIWNALLAAAIAFVATLVGMF
ncbi:MAG: exopolysaccharide biosynthesis protein [Phenylobacterium sp.]|uniref:exopolysaccharide biosynthesis protein n=1 Tax=Phenylobacterium sp. TaxID=1871053 RepID=UPI0017DCA4C2|nr:exopolysaccharide biosynthesis protein [Phenylobacterium sp.]MBA4793896.1 exopolysaccharide biosynthesis protein [Phenylobacterium sp.]